MNLAETIYDILDYRNEAPKRKPRYKNHHDVYVDNDIKVDKKPYATMGRAEYLPPNPSDYLRKHANANANKKRIQVCEKQCLKHSKLPPLPRELNKLKSHKNINFIKKNICSIKKVKPKECEQKLVITRYGDTVNGKKLEPKHIYSKSFGTVPNYIFGKINYIEKNMLKEIDKEEIETKLPPCRYVTRIEREKLLNGLKQNWDELSKSFQLLPIITDSIRRQMNKIEVETKLEKIEKDILLIEKCPYIYVKC